MKASISLMENFHGIKKPNETLIGVRFEPKGECKHCSAVELYVLWENDDHDGNTEPETVAVALEKLAANIRKNRKLQE